MLEELMNLAFINGPLKVQNGRFDLTCFPAKIPVDTASDHNLICVPPLTGASSNPKKIAALEPGLGFLGLLPYKLL